MILGIGLIVIGVLGGLGVYFGLLAPGVQTSQVTNAMGSKAAGIVCMVAAVGLVIAGILRLAGIW